MQVPYTSTNANGVTTSFPFNFKSFNEEDLTITLDGVVQTTGFTVSGIGVETGGSVVFSVAPANGVKVLVANNTIPKRDTNYPQYGELPSDVVNKDFDRIWVAIQYLLQKIRTAIKLPFDTGVEAILTQDAAGRALKYLGFDAGGGLTLESIPDLATTQAAQAAAEAAAATISGFENAGAWVTGTYYTKNNLVRNGGSTYIVVADPGYTSGASAAADIGTGDITIFAQKGDAPPGGGDVLVVNNLSEFTATAGTALSNLGVSAFAKTLLDDADAPTARTTLGIAGAASAGEVRTGTEVAKYTPPSALLAAIGFSNRYNSGNQTLTAAGLLTLAHGLGREPIIINLWLKCITAELGYSIGHKVLWSSMSWSAPTMTIVVDATNLTIRFNDSALELQNLITGAASFATRENWKLVVEALA